VDDVLVYGGPLGETPLPDEWTLRELPAPDAETDTLVDLTTRLGPITRLSNPLELLPGWRGQPGLVAAQRIARRKATEAGLHPDYAVHTAVLRYHLALLNALVGHVVAHGRRKKLATAWSSAGLAAPKQASQAWLWFEETLNAALQPFSLRVSTGRGIGAGIRPLYALGALQVFNLLVEGLPVRNCEHCDRLFVRQQGRAHHGQRWTTSGVRYCTAQCAKAAAQARYRARQRKERR